MIWLIYYIKNLSIAKIILLFIIIYYLNYSMVKLIYSLFRQKKDKISIEELEKQVKEELIQNQKPKKDKIIAQQNSLA